MFARVLSGTIGCDVPGAAVSVRVRIRSRCGRVAFSGFNPQLRRSRTGHILRRRCHKVGTRCLAARKRKLKLDVIGRVTSSRRMRIVIRDNRRTDGDCSGMPCRLFSVVLMFPRHSAPTSTPTFLRSVSSGATVNVCLRRVGHIVHAYCQGLSSVYG